jgi:DNA-binding transcriptional ArsR family regulator
MNSEPRFDAPDDVYALHAEVCKLFTSPVRLKMLEVLGKGERTVEELSKLTGMSQPNTSQHLSLLRKTGVVRSRREGSNVYYSLRDPRLLDAFNNMKAVLSDILNDSRATAVRKRVGRV